MTITIPAGVHICPLCNAEPACGLDEYGDPVACERCDAFVPSAGRTSHPHARVCALWHGISAGRRAWIVGVSCWPSLLWR